VRGNGDVLYVGKAASVRERVAGHYHQGAAASEKALEMLSQARDVSVTPTETPLEAALLECDTIKQLAPPYNRSLRAQDRHIWFLSPDLAHAAPRCDPGHPVGPVPHREPLLAVAAMADLAAGDARIGSASVARACGVGAPFAPDEEVFAAGWQALVTEHGIVVADAAAARGRLLRLGRRLEVRLEDEDSGNAEERPEGRSWTEDGVRAHLAQQLRYASRLLRRARWLVWLSESRLAFREASGRWRLLDVDHGRVSASRWRDAEPALPPPAGWPRPLAERRRAMDLAAYDRLRVLTTELRGLRERGLTLRLGPGAMLCSDAVERALRRV
jgi:hypothetical protein